MHRDLHPYRQPCPDEAAGLGGTTVSGTLLDELAPCVESPEYIAASTPTPAGRSRVLKLAREPLTAADPSELPPSKNSTVPDPAEIVAVRVTVCPKVEAPGETPSDVVVGTTILVGSVAVLITPPFDTEAVVFTVDGAAASDAFTATEMG